MAAQKLLSRNGLGVDRAGGPVIDPTANVIALVEALAAKTDDLRAADNKFYDAQNAHQKEMADLRAKHAALLRTSDLLVLEKTRAVDVSVGAQSAVQLATAVQTLATTSSRDAETLRSQLTATAQIIAKQTAESFEGVNVRLAALERSSYEGKGKEAVSDPMLAQLVTEVKALATSGQLGSGASTGQRNMTGWIFAGIAALGTLFFIGTVLVGLIVYLTKGA
jgi:hypothetical protein